MAKVLGLNIDAGFGSEKSSASGTQIASQEEFSTSKKVLSQDAINKIIYDVLSADSGLASLASGENIGGGYGSSTKALLAQDFVVKTVGELANVMAETQTTSKTSGRTDTSSSNKKSSAGVKTVICTHLHSIGLLPSELYNHPAAQAHLAAVHPYTLAGYHYWAVPLIPFLRKNLWASKLLAPLCKSRYTQVTTGKKTLGGFLTITLGHPVCFLIGAAINTKAGVIYGRA